MITTERLVLYPLDQASYQAIIDGDKNFFLKDNIHIQANGLKYFKPDRVIQLLNLLLFGCDNRRLMWLIVNKEARTVIGDIGFTGIVEDGKMAVDYHLNPEYRHKGYAREALEALVFYQFLMDSKDDLELIEALVDDNNTQSKSCLENAGFMLETKDDDARMRYVFTKNNFINLLKRLTPKNEVITSACLIGLPTRYNGKKLTENHFAELKWHPKFHYLPICPEQLGGLTTPRSPVEFNSQSGQYINTEGKDCSISFEKGADFTVTFAQSHDIKIFLLKQNSPSCGSLWIYDGTFNGNKISGSGCTVKKIIEIMLHYVVLDESGNALIQL